VRLGADVCKCCFHGFHPSPFPLQTQTSWGPVVCCMLNACCICLLIIILVIMGWLQSDSMWWVPSSLWQMGQIDGLSMWLRLAAHVWFYVLYSICQRWHLTLAFFQNEIFMPFSTMSSLIISWYLCSTLWTDGLKPVGRACVLLQYRDLRKWRSFLLKALVGRCSEYLVGKPGKGFPPLLARICMNEWGWASVLMWKSWPLWFSVEHFAMASAHSFLGC
jgi:hypothetical protein